MDEGAEEFKYWKLDSLKGVDSWFMRALLLSFSTYLGYI